MQKKGQVAMEFLMTYGWTILAAIIAIGVLVYFGVFSPGKYVTGNAVVNPPFYVNAQNVKASAGVTLELRNNGGEDYEIQSVVVSGCGSDNTAIDVAAGETAAVTVTCDSPLLEGRLFRGEVTIIYRGVGSDVDLKSTGTISSKVVA